MNDFESIAIIGRGAFGEVRLCRSKNGELVAVKKMKKEEMIKKNQVKIFALINFFKVTHVRAERDILAKANYEWIVDLKCSFQDDYHLYLVMEYLGGGDLMTLLMKKDILTEEEARFYLAECVFF